MICKEKKDIVFINDCNAIIEAYFSEVGCLIIGRLENEIERFCFINGFDVEMKRGKGILSKPLYVRIKAQSNDATFIIKTLENYGGNTNKI